ncbi:MAG: sarcosine oxidase subunit gamma family protein [Alsobacter sp.]
MAEAPTLMRAALPAAPVERPGVRISALPAGHVIQVLAASGSGDLRQRVSVLADGTSHALRKAGPDGWYLVGEAPWSRSRLDEAGAALGESAALVDQSHGRVRIGLSGPGCRRLLATGTAVDLSDAMFPVGAATETLFGHVGVHLTRVGEDAYEILVGRTFAQTLWDELCH